MKADEEKEDSYLINKRDLGELFDSKFDLNLNLYRGSNPNNSNPTLYPILKAFLLSDGRIRKPDINTYFKNGEQWINAKSGGISLLIDSAAPVKSWNYYLLAAGTRIPMGLVITKDDFNEKFNSFHYSIRAQWDMPVSKFCMLLDELARQLKKGIATMLDESDILNLIRLNELELRKTYLELESPDDDVRNNAGEMVLQVESLSRKLRQLYEDAAPDYDIYPKYDEYIKRIK